MTVTFRQVEGITLVELQGLMDFNPRDLDRLKHIEGDIDRHLEAGARAFLIDMQKVKFGYTASSGKFLEVWVPILKSRRARVAFLLARQTERKPVFQRLLERTGLVPANELSNDYWRSLGDKGSTLCTGGARIRLMIGSTASLVTLSKIL